MRDDQRLRRRPPRWQPGGTLITLVVGALLFGPLAWAQVDFVDVTASRNLIFVGSHGTTFPDLDDAEALLQRNMGNGAAVGDIDGDGDLDVYLLGQLGHPNQLFRNELNFGIKRFADVTTSSGLGNTGQSRVAQFVDLDNNGALDLVLLNDDDPNGDYPGSRIYRNLGNGTFADATQGSGFNPSGYLRCGMAIADYDRDGLPDIYITNWAAEVGTGNPLFPGSNRLFRNLGNFTFQDVTDQVGLQGLDRDSFTAVFHDFNDDGYPDIYVAIDHTSDEFYWNVNGSFTPATTSVGATHKGNDMGLAVADIDDDNDLDIYLTNITDPDGNFGNLNFNVLGLNREEVLGTTRFEDHAVSLEVEDTYWGWGVEFVDVENDRDLDIVAVTGFDEMVWQRAGSSSSIYQSPSVLFLNHSTGPFVRVLGTDLDLGDDSRALVVFDYDRDGDQDLLITNVNQTVRLLENVTPTTGHWLQLDLVQQAGGNRDGIGATVRATIDGTTTRRELIAGGSYMAGTPLEVHLGLGEHAVVDLLKVEWSEGPPSSYSGVLADRFVTITQGVSDSDLDGVENSDDCAPTNGGVWTEPGAVTDLTLSGTDETTLQWSNAVPAGFTRFDLLRSSDKTFQAEVVCLGDNGLETSAVDSSVPDDIAYFLVRSRNSCGDNGGADSAGTPRSLPACTRLPP